MTAPRAQESDAFIIDRGRGERIDTLEAADRPYRLLVESMLEGALVLRTDGQILFSNAALASLVRVQRAAMVGEPIARFIAPEDRPTLTAMRLDAASNPVHRDVTMLRADGTMVPVHVSMTTLASSDMAGVCAIVTDLTERRRHEEMSRAQALLKEADRRAPEPPKEAPACRVLVVDDNVDSAVSLGLLLENYGCITHVVHDGLAALDAVETFNPLVVLLNLGMPKLDGNETCKRLREGPHGGDLIIIALTGWGQAEDRRRTRESGFDLHMVKPVHPATLMNVLSGNGAGPIERRRRG